MPFFRRRSDDVLTWCLNSGLASFPPIRQFCPQSYQTD